MPTIDFPASPSVNDLYTFGAITWKWNGTGWEKVNNLVQPAPLWVRNNDWVTGSVGSGVEFYLGASSGNTYSAIQAFTAGNSANGNLCLNPSGGPVAVGHTSPSSSSVIDVKTATNRHFMVRDTASLLQIAGLTDAAAAYASMLIDGNGIAINSQSGATVTIGSTTSSLRLAQKLEAIATGDYGGGAFTTWSSAAADSSTLIDLNRSKSSTPGTYTAVANNDTIGSLLFRGSDGTAFSNAASIGAYCDGTVATGQVPGRLSFRTANASGTLTEALKLDKSQVATFAASVIAASNGVFGTTAAIASGRITAGTTDGSAITTSLVLDNANTAGKGTQIIFYQSGSASVVGTISNAFDGAHWNMKIGTSTVPATITLADTGGMQIGAPTGGDKGSGTLNAAGSVYSAGSALTCFVIEWMIDGRIDLAKWDGYSASGKHALAHEFVDDVANGKIALGFENYRARIFAERALPGMPSEKTWRMGDHSIDELQMRQWLATELLAAALIDLAQKVERSLSELDRRTSGLIRFN